jgi:hypothetical protein
MKSERSPLPRGRWCRWSSSRLVVETFEADL